MLVWKSTENQGVEKHRKKKSSSKRKGTQDYNHWRQSWKRLCIKSEIFNLMTITKTAKEEVQNLTTKRFGGGVGRHKGCRK
jgi:hypothetical protein